MEDLVIALPMLQELQLESFLSMPGTNVLAEKELNKTKEN